MVQFVSYVRRVLHKTRLIFSSINGPNKKNLILWRSLEELGYLLLWKGTSCKTGGTLNLMGRSNLSASHVPCISRKSDELENLSEASFSLFVCFQYFSHNGILILLGISVVVQLSFSLKGLLSFGIVAAYCIVNIFVKGQIFDSYDHFVHHNLR